MEETERLQKYIASTGILSRRKAEEAILEEKVKVDGEIVTQLGTKINPKLNTVEYNGKVIEKEEKKVYVLLNKPIDYVTTVKDQFNRNIVTDLIKGVNVKLIPVGRLDMYTSGALILTNDGDFIFHVTHPKHEVSKTYNATVKGKITSEDVEKLRQGVQIEDYTTRPAEVKILKIDEEKNISRIQITIHEGKNRQVRKMCEAVGKRVLALHRARIGNISVKDLKIGEWRYLTKKEVEDLLKGE